MEIIKGKIENRDIEKGQGTQGGTKYKYRFSINNNKILRTESKGDLYTDDCEYIAMISRKVANKAYGYDVFPVTDLVSKLKAYRFKNIFYKTLLVVFIVLPMCGVVFKPGDPATIALSLISLVFIAPLIYIQIGSTRDILTQLSRMMYE
ncbi:MAG: hypothetical protein ABW098_04400 [Candidatus Thiodiazotropha sp.]